MTSIEFIGFALGYGVGILATALAYMMYQATK